MDDFFDFDLEAIDGSGDLLGALRGRVVLAVNVASQCGLTPQYTGLERLQRELAGEDFSVVGFPCNQFAGQEPGSAEEIVNFCRTTYGVSFPLSEKLDVNGPARSPVYEFLTSTSTGVAGDITWNFEKFLVGADGNVIGRFRPQVDPHDADLVAAINGALSA